MKKILILIFVGFAHISAAVSQEDWAISTLDGVLADTDNDTLVVDILNELAWRYRISNQALALQYAARAETKAIEIDYQKGLGSSYVRKGLIEKSKGNYIVAEDLYKKALKIRADLNDSRGIAAIYNNLGNIDNIQGEYELALSNFKLGLSHLREGEFIMTQARLKNNIGETYYFRGDLIDALIYFEESLSIRESQKDERGMMGTYLDLGSLYLKLNNIEKSSENYKKSIALAEKLNDQTTEAKCSTGMGWLYVKIGDTNQGLEYLFRALKLEGHLDNNDRAILQKNFGVAFQKAKKYEQSQVHYKKAHEHLVKQNPTDMLIELHFNMGSNDYALENFNEALASYQKSLKLLDKKPNVLMEAKVHHMISEAYAMKGVYNLAFEHGNQATMLQDTVNEKFQKVLNFERNREEELKNKANLNLEKAKNEQQTLIIIGLSIALGLGAIAFFSIITAYRSRQQRILQKKENEQKVNNLLKDQEIKATYARLEGQDAERQRISQDLHDRLGSMLSTVKLYFKAIDTKLDNMQDESVQHYVKANDLLDQACEEVRKVSHDLQSGILTKFGLQEELMALAGSIKESNQLHVDVVIHGLEDRLNSSIEVKVYRIIQELVGNVLKHANASKIVIQLNKFKDILNIVIQDDGRGFIEEKARCTGGMGLLNIQSRVLDLSGEMHIDSGKGNGTTVTIDVPCSVNDVLQSNSEDLNL